MRKTNTSNGIFHADLMLEFPSQFVTRTFSTWIMNKVGLEQLLVVAGFLMPDFFEVDEYLFWDQGVAECYSRVERIYTEFGDDPVTIERVSNRICLGDFLLLSADEACDNDRLLEAFAHVIREFWGRALRDRFPDRQYQFEIANDLYGEDGLCITFWRVRS